MPSFKLVEERWVNAGADAHVSYVNHSSGDSVDGVEREIQRERFYASTAPGVGIYGGCPQRYHSKSHPFHLCMVSAQQFLTNFSE